MLRVPVFAAFAFGLCLAYTGANEGLAQPLMYQIPDETAEFRPGPGVEVARDNCAACHSADYILTPPPHKGRPFWQGEVEKMIKVYGAPIEDARRIVEYLVSTY